jgi:hypothetical protein
VLIPVLVVRGRITETIYSFPDVRLNLVKETEKTGEIVIHFLTAPSPPKDKSEAALKVSLPELEPGKAPIQDLKEKGKFEMQIAGIRRKLIELDQVRDGILALSFRSLTVCLN